MPSPTTPQPQSGYATGGYGQGSYGNAAVTSLTKAYYLGLITSQYQGSPKFLAWLSACLQPLQDVNQLIADMLYTAFDVDAAVGAQLNILGSIAGTSRMLPFQPSNGVSPILDDDAFRLLIKATIAMNQWDGTPDGLQGQWQLLFPGGTIGLVDHENMTATVVIPGLFTSIVKDLIVNGLIVPRPEGVEYRYTFASKPLFGFDQNNANIAGFDAGHFS